MMLICTSCSHPLADHDDEDGCIELDFDDDGQPIECDCERTALDQLYETVAERDAAVSALRWYADPANHDRGPNMIPWTTNVMSDRGDRARQALAATEGER